MLRTILAVVAGVFAWWAAAFAGGWALRAAWPAYATVEKSMAFDLPMMAARLALGAAATLVAGAVAARLAPASRYAAWALGTVMLVTFIPVHVSLWPRLPPWYHLTFLGSLIVLGPLGGALVRRQRHPG